MSKLGVNISTHAQGAAGAMPQLAYLTPFVLRQTFLIGRHFLRRTGRKLCFKIKETPPHVFVTIPVALLSKFTSETEFSHLPLKKKKELGKKKGLITEPIPLQGLQSELSLSLQHGPSH